MFCWLCSSLLFSCGYLVVLLLLLARKMMLGDVSALVVAGFLMVFGNFLSGDGWRLGEVFVAVRVACFGCGVVCT